MGAFSRQLTESVNYLTQHQTETATALHESLSSQNQALAQGMVQGFEGVLGYQQQSTAMLADLFSSSISKIQATQPQTYYIPAQLSQPQQQTTQQSQILVNQGVVGRSVYEDSGSVIARQYERYQSAAARGDTKWMNTVKAETEAATGQVVNW